MFPLPIQIVVKGGLWQHALWDPTSFLNTHMFTNDARELTESENNFCLHRGLNLHATYLSILGVMYKILILEDVDAISRSRMEEPQPSTKSRIKTKLYPEESKNVYNELSS